MAKKASYKLPDNIIEHGENQRFGLVRLQGCPMRLRHVPTIIIWGESSKHYRWRQLNYRLPPRKAMNWPRIWDPKQMKGLLRTHDLHNGGVTQGLRGAEQDVLSKWLRFLSTRLWSSVSPTFIHAASEVICRQISTRLSGSINRFKEAPCKICNLI